MIDLVELKHPYKGLYGKLHFGYLDGVQLHSIQSVGLFWAYEFTRGEPSMTLLEVKEKLRRPHGRAAFLLARVEALIKTAPKRLDHNDYVAYNYELRRRSLVDEYASALYGHHKTKELHDLFLAYKWY